MSLNINNTVVILNHIPKTGGTSALRFFEQIYGKEKCFREGVGKNRIPISDLDASLINNIMFASGHFFYGNHVYFKKQTRYICILRDPIERMVSAYYYEKARGTAKFTEALSSSSPEEYIEKKLKANSTNMLGPAQNIFMSNQRDSEITKNIVRFHYLACCTIEQLDELQCMFARIYGKNELKPLNMNRSARPRALNLSGSLIDKIKASCSEDYRLIDWVRERFEKVYRDMDHPIPTYMP